MNGTQDEPDAEDEPFLIDPGSEDPGAGIDQIVPESAPAADDQAAASRSRAIDQALSALRR